MTIRSFLPALAIGAIGISLAGTAMANIDPKPVEADMPLLTPTRQDALQIAVSAEEVDACRATLAQVLGTPPLGFGAGLGQTAAPSLPVVQCVIEARNE